MDASANPLLSSTGVVIFIFYSIYCEAGNEDPYLIQKIIELRIFIYLTRYLMKPFASAASLVPLFPVDVFGVCMVYLANILRRSE